MALLVIIIVSDAARYGSNSSRKSKIIGDPSPFKAISLTLTVPNLTITQFAIKYCYSE